MTNVSNKADIGLANQHSLPAFSLNDYVALLIRLRAVGYKYDLVSHIKEADPSAKVAYIRHDIDLHICGIEQMATEEAARGVHATYYIPLTLHFNPLYPENQRTLRYIVDLGHEIGLHYDLETYPIDPDEARRHLDWEVSILSEIVGQPVRTICMHQPHQDKPDPFQTIDDYIHPHNPCYQEGLLYVSDSCRAWRDRSLLTCFGPNPPRRLLLNIHPELWLDGTVGDRMQYLDQVLMENGVRQHRDYFDRKVREVWMTHLAPRLHDEREQRKISTR